MEKKYSLANFPGPITPIVVIGARNRASNGPTPARLRECIDGHKKLERGAGMDIVQLFAYFVDATLVALGALVAVNSKWAERHKRRVGGALVVLGLVALAFTIVQGARENAAAKRRDEAEALNVKLQGEILEISKENREITTETLRVALGDPDNPPYLWTDFDVTRRHLLADVYIVNPSKKYGAHSVSASMPMDTPAPVASRAASVPPDSRVPADFPNKLGVGSNRQVLPELDAIGARRIFESTIASSAGSWAQVTLMVRSSATTVLQAVRVSKLDDPSTIVFSKQDPGFPPDFPWPTPH